MEELFILVRLPFFFISIIAWTWIWIFLGTPLYLIAVSWSVIILPLGRIIVLPFILISAAFSNDAKKIESHLMKTSKEWNESVSDLIVKLIPNLINSYKVQWNWLIGKQTSETNKTEY